MTCTVKEVAAPSEIREGVTKRGGDEKKVDEELVDDVDGGATSTDLTDWQVSSPVAYNYTVFIDIHYSEVSPLYIVILELQGK